MLKFVKLLFTKHIQNFFYNLELQLIIQFKTVIWHDAE